MERLRNFMTMVALGGFVLSLSSARACEPTRPDPNVVNFASVVREAANITIARVAGASPLPPDHSPTIEDDTTRFTLRTVERIKGNAPAEFVLDGAPTRDANAFIASANADHNGMGDFWWRFGAGCGHFPNIYAVGAEFLILSDANGSLLAWREHNVELIPSRDDGWLTAVRVLAANPTQKKGRKAKLTDFLSSADTILVSETITCERYVRRQRVRQIWGSPLSVERLTQIDDWQVNSYCQPGRVRLTIAFASGYRSSIPLDVSGDQGIVDFTGFLEGSLQGLAPEVQSAQEGLMLSGWLWYSQIDLDGPRVWRLADLEATLRAAAHRKQ